MARVERLDWGRMAYSVLWVPEDREGKAPFVRGARVRFEGQVNGHALAGAFHRYQGRHYVLLAQDFIRQAGLPVGPVVEFRFNLADAATVELPPELERALAEDPLAEKIWLQLTPGRQRGFVHRVGSAQREETRHRRARDVVEHLLETGGAPPPRGDRPAPRPRPSPGTRTTRRSRPGPTAG